MAHMYGIRRENLSCPVCIDTYKTPKILPCGHTVCLEPCLKGLVQRQSSFCPICRVRFFIPLSGKCNDFPTNFALKTIIDAKECETTTALHKQDIPELTKPDINESMLTRCEVHNQSLDRGPYCETCKTHICYKCVYTTHKGHEYSDPEVAANHLQKYINEILQKIEQEKENHWKKMKQYREKEFNDEMLKNELLLQLESRRREVVGELLAREEAMRQTIENHFKSSPTDLEKLHSLKQKLLDKEKLAESISNSIRKGFLCPKKIIETIMNEVQKTGDDIRSIPTNEKTDIHIAVSRKKTSLGKVVFGNGSMFDGHSEDERSALNTSNASLANYMHPYSSRFSWFD